MSLKQQNRLREHVLLGQFLFRVKKSNLSDASLPPAFPLCSGCRLELPLQQLLLYVSLVDLESLPQDRKSGGSWDISCQGLVGKEGQSHGISQAG